MFFLQFLYLLQLCFLFLYYLRYFSPLLQKDFWLIFNRIFTENCLLFAFLRHFASRACDCKKIPLVVFFIIVLFYNCNFVFVRQLFSFLQFIIKNKNFQIKNAVTTVFFHGHHGNFISFYIFLYTICFTGRMKYNTSSLLFIVITQLLCWANCIFMASAFITLRQSLRYFAL